MPVAGEVLEDLGEVRDLALAPERRVVGWQVIVGADVVVAGEVVDYREDLLLRKLDGLPPLRLAPLAPHVTLVRAREGTWSGSPCLVS